MAKQEKSGAHVLQPGMTAPPDRARRGADLAVGPASAADPTPVQRLRGAVRRLYEAGEVGPDAWEAAERFRRDCEFGLHGASAPHLDRPIITSRDEAVVDRSCYVTARLNALGRYRRACAALGHDGVMLLTLFAVDGLSISGAADALRARRLGRTFGGDLLAADAGVVTARAAHAATVAAAEALRAKRVGAAPRAARQAPAAAPPEDDIPLRRASLKRELLAALDDLVTFYEDERRRLRALRAARDAA